MKNILIILGITLLLTSLACGSESNDPEPLVNTETTTKEAAKSDETDTTSDEEVVEEVVKENAKSIDRMKGGFSDAEVVITLIQNRLENETDCGFLLEETDWTTEFNKMKKLWLVSVTFTDAEESKSYSWKFFAMDEEIVSEQDECHLSGGGEDSSWWAGSGLPNQQAEAEED